MQKRKFIFLWINVIAWLLGTSLYYLFESKIAAIFFSLLVLSNAFFLYQVSKKIISIVFLFNIFFLGSVALACFQWIEIERIQWSLYTWCCFFVFNFSFYFFALFLNYKKMETVRKIIKITFIPQIKNVVFYFCAIFSTLSIISFTYFYFRSGFIPLFSADLDAYIMFGRDSVLAIFYQLSVILPCVCEFQKYTDSKNRKLYSLFILLNLLVCIFVKSRDYLTSSFSMLFVAHYITHKDNYKKLVTKKSIVVFFAVLSFLSLFLYVTSQRGYSESYYKYLYGDSDPILPVPLVPIYAYITTTYYNFDMLVCNLDFHTYGLYTLSPWWTLFHVYPIKEYISELPKYYIRPEINMYSSLGVPFFDFNIFGIMCLGMFYGYYFTLAEILINEYKSAVFCAIYAICVHHIIFVFFTSWITSFQYLIYFILLIVVYLFSEKIKIPRPLS